jgi:hypothetical protein
MISCSMLNVDNDIMFNVEVRVAVLGLEWWCWDWGGGAGIGVVVKLGGGYGCPFFRLIE